MNKKVTQVASSSGSPMAAQNEKPAETKSQIAPFATSDDRRALIGALTLAKTLAIELYDFCHCEHHKNQIAELGAMLKELNDHPKSAND